MSFVLLSASFLSRAVYFRFQYAAGTLPKPKDKNVKIRSVPAHSMVAVRFRGRSPDEVKDVHIFPNMETTIIRYQSSFRTILRPPFVFCKLDGDAGDA